MNWFTKSSDTLVGNKDIPAASAAPVAFPDIGDDKGLEDHVPGADEGARDATPGNDGDLVKQFDDFRKESAAREDRLTAALVSASAPAVPLADAVTAEPIKPFEPADLPDMVEDPAGYAKVVQENATGSVQHMLDSQAAESANNASGAGAYDGMWSRFQEKYEDLAKHEELVEVHAGKVAKTLKAQGIDVNAYMVQNRDRFLDDVAKSVAGRLTELGMEPTEGDGERPDPMKGPNRTGGLPGVGVTAPVVKDEVPSGPGSFIAEIQKTQKSMGLI